GSARPKETEMKAQLHIGYHSFHEETNMNFQLHRPLATGYARIEDIRQVAPRIKDFVDWKREFVDLARTSEREGRLINAMAYWRAAEFFLSDDDPDKQKSYDRFIELFHECFSDDFRTGKAVEEKVPYEGAFLPVMRLGVTGRRKRGTILVHGGFDSFIQEFYGLLTNIRDTGFEIIAFEGPGQGEVLIKYGLPMTHEWERPVSAILNHYHLDDVTLIGISLGGYLGPRAAAFEKRIARVVAYDVLYDSYECFLKKRGTLLGTVIRVLMALRARPVINALARARMRRDFFVKWMIGHGMHVHGAKNPYEFIKKSRRYSLKDVSHLITQDILVLAGSEDHFVPLELFYRQARALTNVRSFTGRVFTKAEDAQMHCQIGNMRLVVDSVVDWVIERSTRP
ncbi:MAG: alpha/beta hydrolase, partial [Candidatus Dadabacteria bacterium]|nr:alpha/beta hydrolase [Candidatus Dadabacteria bacterium]